MNTENRKPVWLLIIIVIAILPVFAFPTLLGLLNAGDYEASALAWLYLFYVFFTGWLAWICWPQRKAVTWILIVLMLMSHAAMWGLALFEH